MSNEPDEIFIEIIPPDGKLPPDEIGPWGMLRWRYMRRAELEEKYPTPKPKPRRP